MQARLSPARIESILSAVGKIRVGQAVTVKRYKRVLGLMAAASNVIPFGLLYIAVVAQDQGVFPEGQPISHHQGYTQMPSYPSDVEEALVLGPGSRPCRCKMLTTDTSLTGLGWSSLIWRRFG